MPTSIYVELHISRLDRHRGGGYPPTPATPPCVRVRTRRFELVTLAPIDQCRKSERFEVGIGKPHREGLGPGEYQGPRPLPAVLLASCGRPPVPTEPPVDGGCFPLPPQRCS